MLIKYVISVGANSKNFNWFLIIFDTFIVGMLCFLCTGMKCFKFVAIFSAFLENKWLAKVSSEDID